MSVSHSHDEPPNSAEIRPFGGGVAGWVRACAAIGTDRPAARGGQALSTRELIGT